MDNFIPFLLFASAATFTPGPNNIMIMNSGVHFGITKSMPHYLGVILGFPTMILTVALGLGTIFEHFPSIKLILKILGSIYMLYLAWKILTSTNKNASISPLRPWNFFQAILFQWVNVKAWLMTISTVSIFTFSNNYFNNALIISAAYFLLGVPAVGAWLLFGNFLQKILKKDSHRVWFNIGMALALVASIAMILLD